MADLTLIAPNLILPPTQATLPCDDGIPMETQRHKVQLELLIDPLMLWLAQRTDGYIGGNMFVYFSPNQLKNQDYRGPDFFAVLGVPKSERRSWVIWDEGKGPDVVIELLSDSTAQVDKTDKKRIYQDQMRVPEYFWFDPFDPEDWAGFVLQNGIYQPIAANAQGQRISHRLGLSLVLWQGSFKGIEDITWLRWATLDGKILPLPEETVQYEKEQIQLQLAQTQQEKEKAQIEAAQATGQLQQVVQTLLAQGMTVAQVAQLAGLPETQVKQFGRSI